jgi:hypothetical protein
MLMEDAVVYIVLKLSKVLQGVLLEGKYISSVSGYLAITRIVGTTRGQKPEPVLFLTIE